MGLLFPDHLPLLSIVCRIAKTGANNFTYNVATAGLIKQIYYPICLINLSHPSSHNNKCFSAELLFLLPTGNMCGILAVHGLNKPSNEDRARFIALSKRLRHRGPDWSGCFVGQRSILTHERLAVVGVGMGFLCVHNTDQ